jgi:uncharacterized membrane protein
MNFNERIATKATKYFGSMWTFWIFCGWAFLPLIPILSNYKETILYISSGFIQLAALPLIMVGQDIMGRSSEIRAQEDHEMLKQQFQDIKALLEEIKKLHHHTHEMLGTKDDD